MELGLRAQFLNHKYKVRSMSSSNMKTNGILSSSDNTVKISLLGHKFSKTQDEEAMKALAASTGGSVKDAMVK